LNHAATRFAAAPGATPRSSTSSPVRSTEPECRVDDMDDALAAHTPR
jgi:hypothetical protein